MSRLSAASSAMSINTTPVKLLAADVCMVLLVIAHLSELQTAHRMPDWLQLHAGLSHPFATPTLSTVNIHKDIGRQTV